MSRFFVAIAFLCLGFFLITSNQPKKNAVVIFGPKAGVDAQLDQWKPASTDLAKHNVALFRSSEIPNPAEVEKQLSIEPGSFAVVILGRDGHTARRATAPISAEALLNLVESMPEVCRDGLGDR